MSNQNISPVQSTSGDFKTIIQATVDMLPLALATVPWGILCGALSIRVGLTPLQAQLMSIFVFAGAAQLASLGIMGASGSLPSIFTSTFIISSRHLLYSAVFREHIRKSRLSTRCSMAFFLTDEMFAVSSAYMRKHKNFNIAYTLISGIVFYLIWNISTFVGIVAGQRIPNLQHLGLEFAIAATFIAIAIPSVNSRSTLVALVSSGASAVALSTLDSDYSLIAAALIGMFCGYITNDKES